MALHVRYVVHEDLVSEVVSEHGRLRATVCIMVISCGAISAREQVAVSFLGMHGGSRENCVGERLHCHIMPAAGWTSESNYVHNGNIVQCLQL